MSKPNGSATLRQRKPELKTTDSQGHPTEHGKEIDKQMDTHQSYEFGGPVGVTAMMLGFPALMYYLWICLWFYEGKMIHPTSVGDIKPFFQTLGRHIYQDAYPTQYAFKIYIGLIVVQLFFALVMPGVKQKGLPVPSLGYKTLTYHCNALASFYTTIVLAFTLNYTGVFKLHNLINHFGEIMSAAIITSFAVTLLIDILARAFHYGGKPMRMSGVWVYDVFMGASLNPRLAHVDLKMFAEVRVPWILLFMIAVSGAVKQYEDIGHVTANMAFMVLATGLYINACSKGEEMIPQTWDMFHEKFGFMLIFWNGAGVPFTYCYPVLYMARTDPKNYVFPIWGSVLLFTTLLTCYYIFDTSMSQKSAFKMQQQGVFQPRNTFPQLPWRYVENPTYIQTKHGNKLLTSGWWAFLRKPNYTADWIQSLTWGMSAGFGTPITFFYPAFFLTVLIHRCSRDFERCERKYGEDWHEYCRVVKYRFIPGIY